MSTNAERIIRLDYPKIAGFLYFIIIVLSFIPSQLADIRTVLAAEDFSMLMKESQLAWQIGSGIEFLMFMCVFALSWTLFLLTKSVHKNLALLAFSFRFGEAVLGCFVIILYFGVLTLLTAPDFLSAIPPEQLKAFGHFFLKLSGSCYNVLLTVMGVGGIIFAWLFYISKMVPRSLSVWGIITYTTMVFYGLINIMMPDAPKELRFAMVPGAAFEVTMGLWLFFKGIETGNLKPVN